MEGSASIRHSVTCPHCGNAVTLPEWSENVGEKDSYSHLALHHLYE